MSELKVGFVGLGDQGIPMVEAISDAGFELRVWARRPQSFDAISRVKYRRHDSLKSLAVMVDVLSLCLRDDEDIWNLIRQHRLIEALRSGSIVVNHGTGDPTENEHIGAFLAESGIKYLDAPVSGGRPGSPTLKWVFPEPDEAHSRLNRGHQSFRYGRDTTRIGAARWWQLVPRCTPGQQACNNQ
jgi:6-phosphogluconate dehydrogenase (decarboxylating)